MFVYMTVATGIGPIGFTAKHSIVDARAFPEKWELVFGSEMRQKNIEPLSDSIKKGNALVSMRIYGNYYGRK